MSDYVRVRVALAYMAYTFCLGMLAGWAWFA